MCTSELKIIVIEIVLQKKIFKHVIFSFVFIILEQFLQTIKQQKINIDY